MCAQQPLLLLWSQDARDQSSSCLPDYHVILVKLYQESVTTLTLCCHVLKHVMFYSNHDHSSSLTGWSRALDPLYWSWGSNKVWVEFPQTWNVWDSAAYHHLLTRLKTLPFQRTVVTVVIRPHSAHSLQQVNGIHIKRESQYQETVCCSALTWRSPNPGQAKHAVVKVPVSEDVGKAVVVVVLFGIQLQKLLHADIGETERIGSVCFVISGVYLKGNWSPY